MDHIPLDGVFGFLFVAAAAGVSFLALLLTAIVAAVKDRRGERFGPVFLRLSEGPLTASVISLLACLWATHSPGKQVDDAGPFVAAIALAAGVAVGIFLARKARRDRARPARTGSTEFERNSRG